MTRAARTITQAFRNVAAQFPDRTAVTAPDGDFTYRELDARTDALAEKLVREGAGRGSVVTLLTPRSADFVAGMLGILKSGAAYLPVDPEYPPARIAWTVRDSGSSLAVAGTTTADLLTGLQQRSSLRVVTPDEVTAAPIPATVPDVAGDGGDLAYVIYTSGSTGDPKGVLVEQHSVLRLFDVVREHLAFDEHDVWSMFHSAAFDFSVWETWGALLSGGRLVIVPREVARAPEAFRDLLHAQGVTVLSQTPSAFHGLMAADLRAGADLSALRLVVFGGEALDVGALRPWMDRYGTDSPQLVNMYGITEATVHASYRRLESADLDRGGPSPIGAPLADLSFHLLGDDGRPPADGAVGELFIEGPGLARGYLGRPELEAERFVEHVGADGVSHRRLRTGDRVVALLEGGYGYVGRVDDQLKIRGHRVEPGEIEAVLCGHDEVVRAVVVPHDYGDGDVRLIAFVESAALEGPLAAELAKRAEALLPAYMHPSRYVALTELPLTTNGKVDKERLPPPRSVAGPGDTADATRGTAERIEAIWRPVLDVPHVGHDEDFFSLGGTSLSLVRMFTLVNEEFGTDLDITVLIGGATVAALTPHVDAALARRPSHLTEAP